MITQTQVRWIAEKTLRDGALLLPEGQRNFSHKLRQPEFLPILDALTADPHFGQFIDGITWRINQLDHKKQMNSDYDLHHFVQQAVVMYAYSLVVKMEKRAELEESRNSAT